MSVCPTVLVLRFYGCCHPCSWKSLATASSNQQKGKRGNKKGKQSTESDGSTTDRPKTYIKFVLFQFSYALL